jgi:hypothetical protein
MSGSQSPFANLPFVSYGPTTGLVTATATNAIPMSIPQTDALGQPIYNATSANATLMSTFNKAAGSVLALQQSVGIGPKPTVPSASSASAPAFAPTTYTGTLGATPFATATANIPNTGTVANGPTQTASSDPSGSTGSTVQPPAASSGTNNTTNTTIADTGYYSPYGAFPNEPVSSGGIDPYQLASIGAGPTIDSTGTTSGGGLWAEFVSWIESIL